MISDSVPSGGGRFRLAAAPFGRRLSSYPQRPQRFAMLGLVVVTTVVLYYLYYVEGAVTPLLLPYYHMSFRYFLALLVVSNGVGAFSALIGGLADRIGRANLTVAGTLALGLIQLLAIPHIHTKLGFGVAYTAIGFIEGVILVATPALIRDFSPQVGRASAMGFWTLGPVLGSLTASLVANHTLPLHAQPVDFRSQFVISGVVCLGVSVLTFAFLRELAPGIRNQLMVTLEEESLIEARAAAATHGPDQDLGSTGRWWSMISPGLLTSSFAVSVYLLIYFASVSVLTIYWVSVFNRTTSGANGINTWYWLADAVALVLVGLASDRLRVRKPFMLVGGILTVAATAIFIAQAGNGHTSTDSNIMAVVLLGVAVGVVYAPWMAAYSEAVEARNPAKAAAGLAVWGWVLRAVVAASFLVLPLVITQVDPLVDHQTAGAELQAIEAAQPYSPPETETGPPSPTAPGWVIDELRATGKPGPTTLADLIVAYDQSHNLFAAVQQVGGFANPQVLALTVFAPLAAEIQAGHSLSADQIETVASSSQDLGSLLAQEPALLEAQSRAPSQWRNWWWICMGGQLVFVVLVFTMPGRWSPRRAKADLDDYRAKIQLQLDDAAHEATRTL